PTVLPNSAAVVEEGLQLQKGATRRFATRLAARNVPKEARFADSKRKVAITRAAGNHGLQFIFATSSCVTCGKGKLIRRKVRKPLQADGFEQHFTANRAIATNLHAGDVHAKYCPCPNF